LLGAKFIYKTVYLFYYGRVLKHIHIYILNCARAAEIANKCWQSWLLNSNKSCIYTLALFYNSNSPMILTRVKSISCSTFDPIPNNTAAYTIFLLLRSSAVLIRFVRGALSQEPFNYSLAAAFCVCDSVCTSTF